MKEQESKVKNILIVGAGASGVAAAYSLQKHPDKFSVHIWEKSSYAGGVATSENISGPGDVFINDGVQAACPTYRNTLNLMNEFGLKGSPIHMMISFGKGSTFWTNYKKTPLTENLSEEIKRFERTLKIINKFEFFFIFIPIYKVLKWFSYSDAFCYEMVFPLTALFFGTGNQTPNVSSAIVARVFLDDDLRLFDYDSERLLSQSPKMIAFPNLHDMYETIMNKLHVKFHSNRRVVSISRRNNKIFATDKNDVQEIFDEVIFACDAETILQVLELPSYIERKALGNVKYFNDVTVTHEDDEYMEKYYEINKDIDQYFIRCDPNDRSKIEMSFNLSNYQPQLKTSDRNIYQTIFLDDSTESIWTMSEIDKEKIRLTRWWRQFSHTWKHFAFTVLLWRFLQGKSHTWYCGSYTLVNTHEIAIISGFAAARRLGAEYPFPEDNLGRKQFEQYLTMIHGKPYKFGFNCSTFKSVLMTPFMFIACGLVIFLQFILRCCRVDV